MIRSCYTLSCQRSVCPTVSRTDRLSSGAHTAHQCGRGPPASLGVCVSLAPGALLTSFVLCLPGRDCLMSLPLAQLRAVPGVLLAQPSSRRCSPVGKSLPPWLPNPPLSWGFSIFPQRTLHFPVEPIIRRCSPSPPPSNNPTSPRTCHSGRPFSLHLPWEE